MRFASLISGKGTTALALHEAYERGEINDGMVFGHIIASNRKAAESAMNLGIPGAKITVVDADRFGKGNDRNHFAFGEELIRILKKKYIDVVLQNGWMEYTPPNVIDAFPDRIFNQHPGPPEDFGNLKARQVHAAVLFYRRKMKNEGFGEDMWTEMTVQRVHPEFDKGEVVHAQRVRIEESDSPETLASRALPIEHALQMDLLHDIAIGNVHAEHHRHSVARTGAQRELLREARAAARLLYPNG